MTSPGPLAVVRPTVAELRREAASRMRAAGIEGAELDARVLLAHALAIDAAQLLTDSGAPAGDVSEARFADAVARRIAGEPVARITGVKEFWSRPFAVSRDVLVPRPETETLVEAALLAMPEPNAALRVLDLGVGSGALLAALLLERPRASGVGVDRSRRALAMARANLDALGVGARAQFVCGDWDAAIGAAFDLIVANPPYVASHEIAALPREVRDHDPMLALDGGGDGLAAYRAILCGLPGLLGPEGVAVVELGDGREREVAALARSHQLIVNDAARADFSGRPRALLLSLPGRKKTLGRQGEPH